MVRGTANSYCCSYIPPPAAATTTHDTPPHNVEDQFQPSQALARTPIRLGTSHGVWVLRPGNFTRGKAQRSKQSPCTTLACLEPRRVSWSHRAGMLQESASTPQLTMPQGLDRGCQNMRVDLSMTPNCCRGPGSSASSKIFKPFLST